MSAKKPAPSKGKSRPSKSPVDFVYRYNPSKPRAMFIPTNWQAAQAELERGNEQIVNFFDACRAGTYPEGVYPSMIEISHEDVDLEPKGDDGFPVQLPFALIVGCADARVPAELLFGQDFNDLFNIRIAGNVLADECVGSVLYALKHFVQEGPGHNPRGLKLIVALGHRGCGAVKATVQAYRRDISGASIGNDPVGSILRRIFSPAVTLSARALDAVFGPGTSLDEHFQLLHVEVAVYLNAAWQAHDLREWVVKTGDEAATKVGVVYGVFEPGRLRVRAKPPNFTNPSDGSLFGVPPRDLDELYALALDITRSLQHSFGGPPSFFSHRAFFP
jgi:carbonic anhydrase